MRRVLAVTESESKKFADLLTTNDVETLSQAAKSDFTFDRVGAAINKNTRLGALIDLARDPDRGVRRSLLTGNALTIATGYVGGNRLKVRDQFRGCIREFTPEKVLDILIEDDDENIRSAAAQDPALTEAQSLNLANDESPYVRTPLARTTRYSSVLEILKKDKSAHVRLGRVNNPTIDAGPDVVNDRSIRVRRAGAEETRDESAQLRFAVDPAKGVRTSLARNRHLYRSVQDILKKDENTSVQTFLLLNSGTEKDVVLEVFSCIPSDAYGTLTAAMRLRSIPLLDRAAVAAKSRSPRVRKYLFESLTVEEMGVLAEHPESSIREYASKSLVKAAFR